MYVHVHVHVLVHVNSPRELRHAFMTRMLMTMTTMTTSTYLHHEDDGVERDERHDEVLERIRDDDAPDAVLHRIFVVGHVATQRARVDGKVDALFL